MAFSILRVNPYTMQEELSYSRASIVCCNKQTTVIQVQHYVSQAAANAGASPISSESYSCETQLDLDASNPLEYTYGILQASGLYPDAIWNV